MENDSHWLERYGGSADVNNAERESKRDKDFVKLCTESYSTRLDTRLHDSETDINDNNYEDERNSDEKSNDSVSDPDESRPNTPDRYTVRMYITYYILIVHPYIVSISVHRCVYQC